jgi:tetratricopeptide (TPR) repeat protein
LLYHTILLWDDELNQVLEKAIYSLEENPDVWSKTNSGLLYFTMANHQYSEKNYVEAETYMEKACYYDEQYKISLEYVQILVKLNKNSEALTVLKAGKDTTKEAWELNKKANLLLQLKDYKYAIKLYNLITKIDSGYLNNKELA